IVLPPHYLKLHQRFMRMFVNLSLMEMCRQPKAKNQVLYIMDEFFSLGYLESLETASGSLASYKVKLWPILQDITQIKKNYPDSWHTFFANSGIKQFFSISDQPTKEFLKQELSKKAYGKVVIHLREASELDEELASDSGRQIVVRRGKKPLLLRRTNYDAMFSKKMYSPDPDHPKS
ncbi:MAG: type IV secretory system conjugative DNA transfer family protein, partial [Deltaproteobacteria bacterium]|nr:type IV secretory system conjugative DNA transfer family protein [Deltaproteobacteria bacterium]